MTIDTSRITDGAEALIASLNEADGDGDVAIGDVVIVAEVVRTSANGTRARQLRVRYPDDMRFHSRLGLLEEAVASLLFRRFGPRDPGPVVPSAK